MWTRLFLALILAVGTWSFYSPPVYAGCVVEGSVTYPIGANLRDDKCDTAGAKKVTGFSGTIDVGSVTTAATATAAAPSYTEGLTTAALSLTLGGNLRVGNANMESYQSRLLSSAISAPNGGAASATTGFLTGGTYFSTPITLTNSQQAGLQLDANGYLNVNVKAGGGGGSSSVSATSTEGAPTYTEGQDDAALSLDLSGNMRVTLGTLLSGEEVGTGGDTSLIRTSGGVVRGTPGNVMTGVSTNTTTAAVKIPTGDKSFFGSVTGTDPVGQVQKLYGGITSGFVPATEGVLLCTLTLATATTKVDQCPVIRSNNLFYKVVTSNTTGTGASGELTVQY